jgi:uridine kinase
LPNGYVNWDCAEALDLDGLLRDIRKIKQQMTRKFLVVEGHLLFSRQDLIAEFDECILLDLDLQTLLERRQGREFPCSDGTMFTDPPEYVEKVVYPAHVRYNRKYAESNTKKNVFIIDSAKHDLSAIIQIIKNRFFTVC